MRVGCLHMRSHVGCRSAVPEKTIRLFSEVSSSLRVVSSTCGRISGSYVRVPTTWSTEKPIILHHLNDRQCLGGIGKANGVS